METYDTGQVTSASSCLTWTFFFLFMHLSMLSRRGEAGHRAGF